ncbi:TPA: restriction endonuclease, partial [Escherichia coli]
MLRQMTDIVPDKIPYGVLLCVLTVLFLLFPVLCGRRRRRERASEWRHRHYRRKAERVMAQLSSLPEGGAGVKYLRKINPYVFEELLLLAFERRGMRVIRNSRYSGDGGLDGQVLIDGERWLIQAKRYGRTIRPSHIDDFGELLRREGCRGFFVHTGRTGPASRARLSLWPDIELISG